MSRTGLIVLLLVAVGAVGWLLCSGDGPLAPAPNSLDDPTSPAAAPRLPGVGPVLTGGDGSRARAALWIGAGGIVGTVRRDGRPQSATIEVRQTLALDPDQARGGLQWRGLFARLLDMGLSNAGAVRRLSTDDEGRYAAEDLAPGLYEVFARAGDASGQADAVLPTRGARVQADIDVGSGGLSLKGRVLDAESKPMVGAVVLASTGDFNPMGGMGRMGAPATVDEEGRFELTGLSPGKIGVSALIVGRMHVRGPPVQLPSEEEYVLKIPAGTRVLTGRVVAAGSEEPIARAQVLGGAGDPRAVLVISATTSDAEGQFRLEMPPGDGGLFVEAEGYASTMVAMRGVESKDPIVVRLSALAVLHGVVRSKPGNTPVAGVHVRALPSQREMRMAMSDGALTDDQGRYRLSHVPAGDVTLYALGAGWVSPGLAQVSDEGFNPLVRTVESGSVTEVDLEVEAAPQAKGRLTTAEGAAVCGAVVVPSTAGLPSFLVSGDIEGTFGSGVSDEEGNYLIPALVPGHSVTLTARAAGLPQVRSEPFEAVSGVVQAIDLKFPAVRALEVRVVSAQSAEPIAGAVVHLSVRKDQHWQRVPGSWTTGAEGKVRIDPAPEGDIGVYAEAPDYIKRSDPKEPALPASATGENQFDLIMERGLPIGGRLLLPEGVPATALRVTISTSHTTRVNRPGMHLWERLGASEDGKFHASVFPEGTYDVRVSGNWEGISYGASVSAEAGEDALQIKVERSSGKGESAIVYVVDAKGQPVSEGRVTLHHLNGRGRGSSGGMLRSGQVEFQQSAQEGSLWVEIHGVPGLGSVMAGPYEATQREFRITLEAELTVEGVVVGPDGPVPGVRLTLRALLPERENETSDEHGAAHADAEGAFRIGGLGDLEYELSVGAPPEFVAPKTQRVRGGSTGLRIELDRGAQAQVRVLDEVGRPVAGANVRVASMPDASGGQPQAGYRPTSMGRSANVQTNASGVALLQGLDTSVPLMLVVSPPAGRWDLLASNVPNWTARDETIRMEKAHEISGRVVDEQGRSVPSGQVFYGQRTVEAERPTAFSGVNIQEDGTFVIPNLRQGSYEIYAQVDGVHQSQASIQLTRVQAGAKGITLTLVVGGVLDLKVTGLDGADRVRGYAWIVGEGESQPLFTRMQGAGRIYRAALDASKSYTVVLFGLPGGKYVRETGLKADGRLQTLEARRGEWLAVRVPTTDPNVGVGVQLEAAPGAWIGLAGTGEKGEYRLDGLPEGTWTVRANQRSETQSWQGTAQVRTGTVGTIVLQLETK